MLVNVWQVSHFSNRVIGHRLIVTFVVAAAAAAAAGTIA